MDNHRHKKNHCLYIVYNCAGKPELKIIQDPARLGWNPIVKIEHYYINSEKILRSQNSEVRRQESEDRRQNGKD